MAKLAHPFEREEIDYKSPEPFNASKSYIERWAEEVAKELKYKPQNNLRTLVRKLGGNLHILPPFTWEQTDSGSILVHCNNDFDIFISNFTSAMRNQFTIAHELGHYFLHSNQGEIPLRAERFGSDQAEWEANWFAASFLMPEKEFTKDCQKGMQPYSIAVKYGVSEAAAEVRMKSLGLSA